MLHIEEHYIEHACIKGSQQGIISMHKIQSAMVICNIS